MITHDQLVFCLCHLDLRIKREHHGKMFLVGMPISENGDQESDAYIVDWKYDFEPPKKESVERFWKANKSLFDIDPFCEGYEVVFRRKRDSLLKELDSFSANNIRWSMLSEQQKNEAIDYRMKLLNVPQQQDFPRNIVWPNKPDFLRDK